VNRGSFVACGILVVLTSVLVGAYDRGDFLFLDEIRIGMKGTGKTVVAGETISEFSVDVLGVIDEPGDGSDFIIVRVSGEAIGRSGGIAQGMSGSPIYVDGKLVGALSRAATWSKELTPIGLVTPIEQMLGVIDEVRHVAVSSAAASGAVLPGVHVVPLRSPPSPALVDAIPDAVFAYPVSTPLLVSGLSGRSLDLLVSGVDPRSVPSGLLSDFLPGALRPSVRGLSALGLDLVPLSGGAARSSLGAASLVPGAAMGVALATGDVTIGALGTVTYRDGDAVVGFGHPFLSNGEAAFPLTTASVIDTMKTYDAPFKLGTLGATIGTVLLDRLPGVGGLVDRPTPLVELELSIRDRDRAATRGFRVGLVDEPRIAWELLLATGFEAMDEALGRIGQGTVEVTYRIAGDGLPRELVRRDVFLSTQDIALYPPWQLADIVSFLQYNAFQDPKIRKISAEMSVTEDLVAIQINRLTLDQDLYKPGDTIHYTVELQTWRGEAKTVEGTLKIPDEFYSDYVTVRAYGGPRLPEEGEGPPEFANLEDLLQAIEDLPSYDVLTVELFAPNAYAPGYDALAGVEKTRTGFGGQVLYDEREVTALVYAPEG